MISDKPSCFKNCENRDLYIAVTINIEQIKSIARAYATKRECSVEEAVYIMQCVNFCY